MRVDRAQIVSILRSRGLHGRAGWVERELPDIVDIDRNRSLMSTLQIDPDALRPVAGSPGPR